MKPLLISFSGGKTSGLMTAMLHDYQASRAKAIVFANTGREKEETLEFVNECDKRWNLNVVWVEAVINEYGVGTTHKIVNYETACRDGSVFEQMIQKFGIPNIAFPHCTRELKLRPIESYVKRELGWKEFDRAIGIRIDERHRIQLKDGFTYPLAENFIDKRVVNEWWENQPFVLHLDEFEGNCKLCFKKSDKKIIKQINKNPEYADWNVEMERKYADLIHGKRSAKTEPSYFFRGNRNTRELMELAEEVKKQPSLFNELSDVEYDCVCKST